MIILIWIVVITAACWLYFRQGESRFKKYGIKHFKPLPLVGNLGKLLLRKQHISDMLLEMYKAFPEERFFGRYEFTTEMIMVRDLELIKMITVKDFDHFMDHRSAYVDNESYFGRNLMALKGQEWKDMRSTLSPAFTSSKIRHMVPFMVEVGEQTTRALKKQIADSGANYIDIETKDVTTRFANDVIASCAFGLKVDSHADPENDFFKAGNATTKFDFRMTIIIFLLVNAPKLAKFFNFELMDKASKKFFKNLVLGSMKDREERNIIRPDMIHLLMEAKKGKLKHDDVKPDDVAAGFATVAESSYGTKETNTVWSDRDLISQAVLFFLAGFDTVSSSMTFLLYELALNPEVQQRLYQEIKDHEISGEKFDFNAVQKLTYMDMVVSESLRKWPPVVALDRKCIKDYNLGRPNNQADKDYIIRERMALTIPVQAIHRDERYFADPDKFDPERFSEKNRHKINASTYMPFGAGPRNCIGSRFALCEVKVMTYQILQHFELSPCEKTCIPAQLDPESVAFRLKGGDWLRFTIR